MQLSKRQQNRLQSIIDSAKQILADAGKAQPKGAKSSGGGHPTTRRRGTDLVAFKKMLKAERKKGASVADLAHKHGVTPSYIYQMQ